MAKMNIVKILLSLASNYDWTLEQFDVKNAFGNLEEVYMDAPLWFNKRFATNHMYKLKKVFYELKQFPKLDLEGSTRP